MSQKQAAERLRIERELLADLLDDARRQILAGDIRAELLAVHLLGFEPLRSAFSKLGPLAMRKRDQRAARRFLSGWSGVSSG